MQEALQIVTESHFVNSKDFRHLETTILMIAMLTRRAREKSKPSKILVGSLQGILLKFLDSIGCRNSLMVCAFLHLTAIALPMIPLG